MKYFVLLLLILASPAWAVDFTVEDDNLTLAPTSLTSFLRSNTEYTDFNNRPCAFVGKAVSLSESNVTNAWVLTTKPACSWAASAGPIIVVHQQRGRYRILIETMGYDLTIGKPLSNGFRNIATGRATAARTEIGLWVYNGSTYELKWYKGR